MSKGSNDKTPERSSGITTEDFTPDMVCERFQVKRLIGRGNTSRVYFAHDEVLSRNVAIKVLDRSLYLDPVYNQRFEREALALARLCHPNIVTIFDFGYEDYLQTYYLVLELVKGKTIDHFIHELKDQPISARAGFLSSVLPGIDGALTHSHSLNITHRDIKPQNIIVTPEGRPIMTDFGIAMVSDLTSATLPGFSPGTPIFMSPEQLRGKKIDSRSDLYSLALLSYSILSGGKHPFPHNDDYCAIHKRLNARPLPLGRGFSEATDWVFRKALEPYPENRYQTVREFAAQLYQTINRQQNPVQGQLNLFGLQLSISKQNNSEKPQTAKVERPEAITAKKPATNFKEIQSKVQQSKEQVITDHPRATRDHVPLWLVVLVSALLTAAALWATSVKPLQQQQQQEIQPSASGLDMVEKSVERKTTTYKEF